MKFISAYKVNLSSFRNKNLYGFIYTYEISDYKIWEEFYVEKKLYLRKELCSFTGNVLKEESFDNDYHYSIDIFFNDKSRYVYFDPTSVGIHFSD